MSTGSPPGPSSREELREYIRELASELAGEIVRQISASPAMRAMRPYQCTGTQYICTHTYTCSDLKHRCENTFTCPGTYACNDIHVGYGQAFFR
jgi:hypothetical protein